MIKISLITLEMYDLLSWQGNEISRVCIYRFASCQLNRRWMVYHIGELIKISICSEIDFVALNYHMLQLLYYQHTSYHEQGKRSKWSHCTDAGVLIKNRLFQKKTEWKMKNQQLIWKSVNCIVEKHMNHANWFGIAKFLNMCNLSVLMF